MKVKGEIDIVDEMQVDKYVCVCTFSQSKESNYFISQCGAKSYFITKKGKNMTHIRAFVSHVCVGKKNLW